MSFLRSDRCVDTRRLHRPQDSGVLLCLIPSTEQNVLSLWCVSQPSAHCCRLSNLRQQQRPFSRYVPQWNAVWWLWRFTPSLILLSQHWHLYLTSYLSVFFHIICDLLPSIMRIPYCVKSQWFSVYAPKALVFDSQYKYTTINSTTTTTATATLRDCRVAYRLRAVFVS